jgi:hypothetical protein
VRGIRTAVLVVVAALCGAVPPVVADDDAGAGMVFRIHDERVIESSGLALSRTHRGLAYTVNDSGDEARVLVLSMRDGAVVGETSLTGVEADDFEALAPAPGGRLVVGDIGDNDAERESVQIYVIPEPGRATAQVRPRAVSATYAEGPRDAEAMVVADETLFVVSKEALAGVFAAPLPAPPASELTLRRVAAAPSVVTDAALLADGDVAMRNYQRGYVASLPDWRVRASYALPRVEQGETLAAALRGRRVYVGTEGSHSPVYEVSVPTTAQAARSDQLVTGLRDRRPADDEVDPRARPTGYIVAVAVALVVGILVRRRRRRGRRAPIQIR